MEIKTVSLKDYSSLNIGGEGQVVVVRTTIELVEVLMYAKTQGLRVHALGEGTNTFFGESLSDFLFVKIAIKGISLTDQGSACLLTAYAGENWDTLVKFAVSQNLWGIENLSYIPGTVGAAPVQNIGAYGAELKDVFVSLSALDLETLDVVEMNRSACHFGYRDSIFKQKKDGYIIISITIKLSKKAHPVLAYKPLDGLVGKENLSLQDVRDTVVKTRKAKLPDYREYPNVGSFFKNPIVTVAQGEALRAMYQDIPLITHPEGFKIPAAWLIEHIASMKGVRVGDVGTWPNQPLVLVNYGQASIEEILNFSGEIVKKVQEKTGIILVREVNVIGAHSGRE